MKVLALTATLFAGLAAFALAPATAQVEAGGDSNAMAGQAAYNAGDFATARAKYEVGCFTENNSAAPSPITTSNSALVGGLNPSVFEKGAVRCGKQEIQKTDSKCENGTQLVEPVRGYGDTRQSKKVLTPARDWS